MKTAMYKEGGWVAKVEILKDESDSEWERYELKVIKTIHEPWIHNTPKDGHIFSCDQERKSRAVFSLNNKIEHASHDNTERVKDNTELDQMVGS